MTFLSAFLLLFILWDGTLVAKGACPGNMTEYPSVPDRCFQFLGNETEDRANQTYAKVICASLGTNGYVYEVTTAARHALLSTITVTQIWLGLVRESISPDVWVWEGSGTPLTDTTTYWRGSEPNNNYSCVDTFKNNQSEWSDAPCVKKLRIVCEADAIPDVADCEPGNPVVSNCSLVDLGSCSVSVGWGQHMLTYNCSGETVQCMHQCRIGVAGPAECADIATNSSCPFLGVTDCNETCGIGVYSTVYQCSPSNNKVYCPQLCCCARCPGSGGGILFQFPDLTSCANYKPPLISPAACQETQCPGEHRSTVYPYPCQM